LLDVLIDFLRRDPATSLAILDGLTFGRTAPPADRAARAAAPGAGGRATRNDLVHPFSDAEGTARELVRGRLVAASSMYEWRLRPARLDTELREFLREVWSEPQPVAGRAGGGRAPEPGRRFATSAVARGSAADVQFRAHGPRDLRQAARHLRHRAGVRAVHQARVRPRAGRQPEVPAAGAVPAHG
jgi:hypothetical protein